MRDGRGNKSVTNEPRAGSPRSMIWMQFGRFGSQGFRFESPSGPSNTLNPRQEVRTATFQLTEADGSSRLPANSVPAAGCGVFRRVLRRSRTGRRRICSRLSRVCMHHLISSGVSAQPAHWLALCAQRGSLPALGAPRRSCAVPRKSRSPSAPPRSF